MKKLTAILILLLLFACNEIVKKNKNNVNPQKNELFSQMPITKTNHTSEQPIAPKGMVWISGATFKQGAIVQDKMAMEHEKPSHKVTIDGFYISTHEVTNLQFQEFVKETGYITIAERTIDWDEFKKQLPEGTPKPHDSIMLPGSLTFKKTTNSVQNLYDFSQWWNWSIGANWKHPKGPSSSIVGKENYPVVHIAYEDAIAYCEWSGERLPTEAEWEWASRGKSNSGIFLWGNEINELINYGNTWEGEFPVENSKKDGFEGLAPVQSYLPNKNGLYDMAGNVWEWTSDWYNSNYYKELAEVNEIKKNPKGALNPYNPNDLKAREKIIKGGSFLCSASYCANYRISARMGTNIDSSLEHLGFRTVKSK